MSETIQSQSSETQKPKAFVNLTAHKLLPQQVAYIRKLGIDEIIDVDEVGKIVGYLLPDLRQSPSDPVKLQTLARALIDALKAYKDALGISMLYVHLPVGSPAFMWYLTRVWDYSVATPVFSHSERISIEEVTSSGEVIKRSKFVFKGFIIPNGV